MEKGHEDLTHAEDVVVRRLTNDGREALGGLCEKKCDVVDMVVVDGGQEASAGRRSSIVGIDLAGI